MLNHNVPEMFLFPVPLPTTKMFYVEVSYFMKMELVICVCILAFKIKHESIVDCAVGGVKDN